jgi:hypothetical protein
MVDYVATGVRKMLSGDATHRHISDVCTQGAIRFTRQEVIDSIRSGDSWKTFADGHAVEILLIDECPREGCSLSPYIVARADGATADNLDALGPC